MNLVQNDISKDYPELSKGIGKLCNFQLLISINNYVKPVVQPLRSVPYQLRSKAEDKLAELKQTDSTY